MMYKLICLIQISAVQPPQIEVGRSILSRFGKRGKNDSLRGGKNETEKVYWTLLLRFGTEMYRSAESEDELLFCWIVFYF